MLKQTYLQGPTPVLEPGRANGNLLGIPNNGFSDKITTKVQMIDKGKIILDKGANSGILKGNTLIDISVPSKPVVEIVESFPGSAIGIEKSGKIVIAGHTLELKGHYTVSIPLVKIYIPSIPVSSQQYAEFINKQIIPLGKKPNFVDEKTYLRDADKTILFWETREKSYKNNIKVLGIDAEKDLFYMMLPVPAYIAEPLKSRIKRNQNMQLVADPAGADFVLYISYSKNKLGRPQYVFTFHSPKIMTESVPGNVIPLKEYIIESSFLLSGPELQKLVGRIYENAKTCLRRKTTAWINEYERR